MEYQVSSQFASLKVSKFVFDIITFQTLMEDNFTPFEESAQIYNISYFHNTWIFSYGQRIEASEREVWDGEQFIYQQLKEETFFGAQYGTNAGFLIGAFYNYYLLNEVSFGLTYFF